MVKFQLDPIVGFEVMLNSVKLNGNVYNACETLAFGKFYKLKGYCLKRVVCVLDIKFYM
jgi:hypothetical protein